MRKLVCAIAAAGLTAFAALAAEQSSVTIEGKAITVQYTPGAGGISANFHTDTDLVFKGAAVPKGDYTLRVLTEGDAWQLVISKQAGAKARDPKSEVGKIALKMSKAAAAAPSYKLTLTKIAALAGKLDVSSGATVATAQFRLDRARGDSEW